MARRNPAKPCSACVCWIFPGCRKRLKSGFDHRNDHRQKKLYFSARRGIMAEIEYPGIAKLVSRLVWDQETVRSSRTTRTKIPLKSLISEGFSYSLSIAAQFLSYSLQQNRPLSVVNPVGSTFNIQKSIPHKSLPSNIFPSCSINLTVL